MIGIKHLIEKKKTTFKKRSIFSDITLELSNTISFSKGKYHERHPIKLNDTKTTPKTYRSILKRFANGSKIPLILSLLVIINL